MNNFKSTWKSRISLAVLAFAALGLVATGAIAGPQTKSNHGQQPYGAWLDKQVHHAIGMLTRYGAFDYVDYSIQGTEVTISGEVVNSTTKAELANSVKGIEGVTRVVDEISVLSASIFDSDIRRAEFRAVFSDASLGQYAMGVVPSIHIIVKNGNVTLEGKVNSESDRNIATLRANSVPGVFSVTNNLRVE